MWQVKTLTEQLRDKDAVVGQRDEELKAQAKQIEELQLSVARERDLSTGGTEAQDRLTYLKNVIFRYLKSGPDAASERQALVPVICTILRFTAEETTEVQRAAAAASGGLIASSLTSLLWGGGGGGGGGAGGARAVS